MIADRPTDYRVELFVGFRKSLNPTYKILRIDGAA
jgi:hypothetical protein